mmetsp:Transcript_22818/g.44853  ORF Transcript_22818/g.44853 Transcript_22818/m.44853 type:complete len:327 (+) Transcript_22818:173-1153(+)
MQSARDLHVHLTGAVESFALKNIIEGIKRVDEELRANPSQCNEETHKFIDDSSKLLGRLNIMCKTLHNRFEKDLKASMDAVCTASTNIRAKEADRKRKLAALAEFMKMEGLNEEDLQTFMQLQSAKKAPKAGASNGSETAPVTALDLSKGKESHTATESSELDELRDSVVDKYLTNATIEDTDVKLQPIVLEMAKQLNDACTPPSARQEAFLVILLTLATCHKDLPSHIKRGLTDLKPSFALLQVNLGNAASKTSSVSRIISSIVGDEQKMHALFGGEFETFIRSQDVSDLVLQSAKGACAKDTSKSPSKRKSSTNQKSRKKLRKQ